MHIKRYTILAALCVFILIWAYKASNNVVSSSGEAGQLLLPNLQKNIDNIGAVIIRSKGQSFKVHLENGNWVMPNKYSYIVGPEKIRDLVQNSANIKIIEAKTSDPQNFEDLGIDDPEKEASKAIRIVFLSADEKTTYADYIRGVNRKGVTAGAGKNEIYARNFDSNQSYLVHGDINFDLGAHSLLNGETFAIKYQNLSSINFTYPHSPADNFTIGKSIPDQMDFVINEPENQKLIGFGKANAISTSLEYMSLEDIAPRENFVNTEPEVIITYKTFNGLTLEVKLFKHEEQNWLMFDARSIPQENPDAAAKKTEEEVARINNLAAPWAYKVDFKSTGGFFYKLEDLIKE